MDKVRGGLRISRKSERIPVGMLTVLGIRELGRSVLIRSSGYAGFDLENKLGGGGVFILDMTDDGPGRFLARRMRFVREMADWRRAARN